MTWLVKMEGFGLEISNDPQIEKEEAWVSLVRGAAAGKDCSRAATRDDSVDKGEKTGGVVSARAWVDDNGITTVVLHVGHQSECGGHWSEKSTSTMNSGSRERRQSQKQLEIGEEHSF